MATKSERASKAAANEEPSLSRERIVETALALLEEKGLEGFSLREVAKTLGVFPTAIYWYVKNKNELLSEACTLAMQTLAPPASAKGKLDWRAWLRELFKRYRKIMRRYPHVSQLVGAQMLSNASLDLPMLDGILRCLEEAGCPPDRMVDGYNTVVATMCGFVTLEYSPLPSEDVESWSGALQDKVHSIPALKYPSLARHLPNLANRAFVLRWQSAQEKPMDRAFDAYVDVFMSGLETQIEVWKNAKS